MCFSLCYSCGCVLISSSAGFLFGNSIATRVSSPEKDIDHVQMSTASVPTGQLLLSYI